MPRILLDLSDRRRRDELAELLTSAGCRIVVDEAEVDVLVTDHVGLSAAGDAGLVTIGDLVGGETNTRHVKLPSSISDREVLTVAWLLTETVRLRRQLQDLHADRKSWRDQAVCDPLTGLLNRRGWDEAITRRWQLRSIEKSPMALAIADIDHFKRLNDTQGHAAGDDALRKIAHSLESSVRPGDIVSRYAGDEFAILLANIDLVHVEPVFNRLRQHATGPVTISIGAVAIPTDDPRTSSELFTAADRALLAAKQHGRNRVIVVA